MTHLADRWRSTGRRGHLYAWCGRVVRVEMARECGPEVTCKTCQAKWAKLRVVLRTIAGL